MITFGPCQTPTLSFCVERYFNIRDFRSEAFWRILPKIYCNNGENITLNWDRDRTGDPAEAELVRKDMEMLGQIQVVDTVAKESTKKRPEG
jgi:DNA topoisomerase-3